jgi:hypothetical protein
MKKIACILMLLVVMVIVYGTGTIQCKYVDSKTATGNTFSAFHSSFWTQTTQAEFESSGLMTSYIDTTTVSGDVLLEKRTNGKYRGSGNLRSSVFDTGIANARIDLLWWSSNLPAGTTITYRIRARDTNFAPDSSTPAWSAVLTDLSPISAGLPTGRYVQWRVYLETTNDKVTPALHEVQVWYH